MATKNEVTGDEIRTKGNSTAYKDNWDSIFNKDALFKKKLPEEKPVVHAAERMVCSECDTPEESGHKISCSKLKL